MYLNLDNIDDEVTELIANEILQGSQEDDGSTAGVRRSRLVQWEKCKEESECFAPHLFPSL